MDQIHEPARIAGAISPDTLSIEEVMQHTQLSRASVYRHIRNGIIPAFRIGRCVRVRRAAFLAWMEAGGSRSAA